jgi:hypothetical protein
MKPRLRDRTHILPAGRPPPAPAPPVGG